MDNLDMKKHLPGVDDAKLELIFQIKKDYEDGKLSLEEANKQMREKVGTVRPYEIAVIEQQFIPMEDDECRKEDIQKMMELYDGVMNTDRPELPEGHPILCYFQENDAMRGVLKEVEDLVQYPVIKNQWYEIYDKLGQFRIHLSRKQNQLYSILERKGFDRPTTTMWTLDDFIRDEIRDLRTMLDAGKEDEFIAQQATLVADVLDLMDKEETVLYPTSLAMITPAEFEEMKSGDREIGFALITPDGAAANAPTTAPASASAPASPLAGLADDLAALLGKHGYAMGSGCSADTVHEVSTGKLTLEQINLIFRHLPVDISYVDENEKVCFYSDTDHRVFPRSKNVIGRDVKNCHPRKSVHIVEEIIEKFRSGEQSNAEFWINKPGLFIYIYYTAVRDADGKFRGVLEMMQDCSHIRSLEGSQTLLNWGDGTSQVVEEPAEEAPAEEAPASTVAPGDSIELTPETKLADLLAAHPWLKNELPEIHPNFKMLKTPLARVMIPKATLQIMSEKTGMDVNDLAAAIAKKIEEHKG